MEHSWHDILQTLGENLEHYLLAGPSEFLKSYQWLLIIKTSLTTEILMSSKA